MDMLEKDVVIAGAGIAGLATALALKRVGVRALVLEKAEELRATGAAFGLFPNAWLALDALGVSHKLTPLYSIVSRGTVTNVSTGAIQELVLGGPQGVKGHGPRPIHRKALLEALAEELPADSIRFSSKLAAVELEEQGIGGASNTIVHLEDGTTIRCKVLIGCDGVHSVVAKWLGLSTPVYSGRSAVRGLAVYPQGHGFKHEAKQFVDESRRAGFVPLNDKEVYWFIVFKSPLQGEHMTAEQIQKEVIENYAKDFPSVYLDVARHADPSMLSVAPLKLRYPWEVLLGNVNKGNVTVAGDAMHPMTPDLAQGGACALEDAVVLGRQIGNSFIKNGGLVPGEVAQAIAGYVHERRWRAAMLTTGAFLSGWVQQDGSKWWMAILRLIFYKYIFNRLAKAVHYDCGKLPSPGLSNHGESDQLSKQD